MYPVAIVDKKLLELAVAIADKRYKETKGIFSSGEALFSEEFGEIFKELNDPSV